MRRIGLGLLLILIVVCLIGGIGAYLYVTGLPHPFCSYRTNVIESIDTLPSEDDLSQYLQKSGWVVKYDDFEKQPKSLAHKEHILEAKTDMAAFFSRPQVTVYIAVMNSRAGVDYEGQLQIFIEQGNRIANKEIYNNFLENLNHEFGFSLSPVGFNYMSFCG